MLITNIRVVYEFPTEPAPSGLNYYAPFEPQIPPFAIRSTLLKQQEGNDSLWGCHTHISTQTYFKPTRSLSAVDLDTLYDLGYNALRLMTPGHGIFLWNDRLGGRHAHLSQVMPTMLFMDALERLATSMVYSVQDDIAWHQFRAQVHAIARDLTAASARNGVIDVESLIENEIQEGLRICIRDLAGAPYHTEIRIYKHKYGEWWVSPSASEVVKAVIDLCPDDFIEFPIGVVYNESVLLRVDYARDKRGDKASLHT